MRETALLQRDRLLLLLFEIAIICLTSWVALGRVLPGNDDKGVWFNTALICLILGVRLDTPHFAKPADAVLYTIPAAFTLLQGWCWKSWGWHERAAYLMGLIPCFIVLGIGIVAILTKDSTNLRWRKVSDWSRWIGEKIGKPRVIFTTVVLYALYAFHRSSPREFGVIMTGWFLIAVSAVEEFWKFFSDLKKRIRSQLHLSSVGQVVGYQTPGIILVRQSPKENLNFGDFIAVKDQMGQIKTALLLDQVGRDEGVLIRSIELDGAKVNEEIEKQIAALPENSVVQVLADNGISESRLAKKKGSLVGIVAPDTSVERLFFEVVKNEGLEEGKLVEVEIGGRFVMYQLVNGLTKEEIVQQKNTYGFARAQAQKIGEWDEEEKQFRNAKWLPLPNSPVFLKSQTEFEPQVDAIGHFPGTNYTVSLRKKDGKEIGIDSLVTHNTAILGILGVGKSTLAMELVERIIARGVKVVCIDLTDDYATELKPYLGNKSESLQFLDQGGDKKYSPIRESGGNKLKFTKAVEDDLNKFINVENHLKLKIYNPSQFEVWKQDGNQFKSTDTPPMSMLTPAEITRIISEATLKIAMQLGTTNNARICLVYEEAHSLIPEWNSTVSDADKAASNGTARAILQGRKYGLGCLLITQRTANVTKTILNQCNSVFAMRTFDETGKSFLANYLGQEYADIVVDPKNWTVFHQRNRVQKGDSTNETTSYLQTGIQSPCRNATAHGRKVSSAALSRAFAERSVALQLEKAVH